MSQGETVKKKREKRIWNRADTLQAMAGCKEISRANPKCQSRYISLPSSYSIHGMYHEQTKENRKKILGNQS
jgi:hypothetical protein